MGAQHSVCVNLVSPRTKGSIIAYDVVAGLPTVVFLVFLGWSLKSSLRKLQRSQSHIMTTYYVFLWVVSFLNVVRCFVQMAEVEEKSPVLWNVLWLLTRFGLALLEVSVVVFLLQGYLTSGREALLRTLCFSGAVAGVEAVVTAIYVFPAHVPLFLYGGTVEDPGADMHWSKWGFWLAHATLFLSVYACILVLPYTKWRDRLPAKPSFYRYVLVLFMLNLVSAVGALLLGSRVASGYCLYAIAHFLYYALYPPLLYITFLAEFLMDNELDMDLLYYSEMKDAGYFEDSEYDEY